MTRAKAFTAGTDRKYKYDSLSNLVYESDITGGALTGDDTPGTVAGGTVNTTDYRYNNLNQLTNLTVDENQNYVYTYDKNGNETSETLSGADVTGGSTGTVQLAMTYDVANKMVKGVNAAGEQSSYTYNAIGALVNNTKISGTPSQSASADYVVDYTTNTGVPLVETESGGNAYKNTYGMSKVFSPVNSSALNSKTKAISVYDKVSAKSTNATSGALISKLYLEQDRLGSTKFATADDGSAAAYINYNEWGVIGNDSANLASLQPAVYDNLKSYTGHAYDGVLTLYYAKARMYDPNIKRFTQIDPARNGDNWYLYVENNPVNIIDPIGLDSYIFYDPNGYGQNDLYVNAGKKELENRFHTPCYLRPLSDNATFIRDWNNMGKGVNGSSVHIDAVVFLAHGGSGNGANEGGFGYYDTNGKYVPIWNPFDFASMDQKNMDYFISMGCSVGQTDYSYNFAKRILLAQPGIKAVIAADGEVASRYEGYGLLGALGITSKVQHFCVTADAGCLEIADAKCPRIAGPDVR